jgi:hypothetical protein
MLLDAFLLTPYLAIAASLVLAGTIAAVCCTQPARRTTGFAVCYARPARRRKSFNA